MSLYGLTLTTMNKTYHSLPKNVIFAATSAALSYGANRYTRFTLPNPMDAAKIAFIRGIVNTIAHAIGSQLESRVKSDLTLVTEIIINLFIYKTITPTSKNGSLLISTILFGSSNVIADKIFEWALPNQKNKEKYMSNSLDAIGYTMAQSVYRNIPRTALAAGSAWFTAKSIQKLGLDPKVTMVFTAAASALYYATKPLFSAFENREYPQQKQFNKESEYSDDNNYSSTQKSSKNQKPIDNQKTFENYLNNGKRVLTLLGLTKVSADLLKLDLPMYVPFFKTCSVASALIYMVDNTEKVMSYLRAQKKTHFED